MMNNQVNSQQVWSAQQPQRQPARQEEEGFVLGPQHFFLFVAGLALLILLGVIIKLGWSTLAFLAPWIVGVIAVTVTLAFPIGGYALLRHFQLKGKIAWFLARVLKPNAQNMYPVLVNEDGTVIRPEPGAQPIPANPHTYAPHIQNEPAAIVKLLEYGRGMPQLPQTKVSEEVDTRVIVPPPFDLMEIVHTSEFKSGVFLGRIGASRSVVSTNPGEELCHGAIDAPTGGGKTILIRGLEPQLLSAGFRVVHADVKFTLHDRTYDLDYRPIAKTLLGQGNIPGTNLPHLLVLPEQVRKVIAHVAGPMIDYRLALYREGKMDQLALFYFFLEELAYLQSLQGKDKSLSQDLDRILMVGRSLNIKLFTAAQNFQTQNAGVNTGNRENFESAWYLGGDNKSGAALLDIKETELNKIMNQNSIQLGKGAAFFRNNTLVHDATVMRAGMASNAYVYHMLGHADDFVLPAEVTGNGVVSGSLATHGAKSRILQRDSTGRPVTAPTGRFTGDLRAFSQGAGVPDYGRAQPVEPMGARASNTGVPPSGAGVPSGVPGFGREDRMMNEVQIGQFIASYPDTGNIRECLKRIEGCNSRHAKHAGMIVREYGLKKREA